MHALPMSWPSIAALAESGLESRCLGDIGNNHLHVNILPRDAQGLPSRWRAVCQWAAEVTAMGGAVSAEHGVGKIQAGFLETMYGHEAMVESARLKQAPARSDGQLGRGNLFSEKLLDELVQKGAREDERFPYGGVRQGRAGQHRGQDGPQDQYHRARWQANGH